MPDSPSREDIAASQLARLRCLLETILPRNAFYQTKLAGLNPSVDSLGGFFARFPFTTKQELVENQLRHPPFGRNLTFPLDSYTRFHQTSGTTRAPLRWLDTPASWRAMVESWKTIYRAAGVGPGDRVYFAFSFGPFIGFWLAFDAAHDLGCLCLPGGGLGSEGRLRAIIDNQATVLCCTPSYAIHLGETAATLNIPVAQSAIRAIIVAGEPGGGIPATRQRLQKAWPKARLFDHHGMTETGPVSYECPRQPGILHIIDSAYLAEVIDPAGKEVPSGGSGELVLTTLGRAGSPLLRYRTGDLVRRAASSPCGCGSHETALVGGILGRVDEMVIIRGVNIFPTAVEEIVRGFDEIIEYQARVDRSSELLELRLEIEPRPDCPDPKALAARLERALHAAFNLRVPVQLAAVGALPRFEMKARRWKF